MDGLFSSGSGWLIVTVIFLVIAINIIDIGRKRK